MKRKIKKHLFHINEIEQYKKLFYSSDKECKELAVQLFLSSKTYRHYIKRRFSEHAVKYMAEYGKDWFMNLIVQYSHMQYKKIPNPCRCY